MFKKIIICLTFLFIFAMPANSFQKNPKFYDIDAFDNMPILERDNFGNDNPLPIAKRGPEYKKYLYQN